MKQIRLGALAEVNHQIASLRERAKTVQKGSPEDRKIKMELHRLEHQRTRLQ